MASQLKTFTAEGTRDEDGADREGHAEIGAHAADRNMWWPHTTKLRPAMATIAPTMAL